MRMIWSGRPIIKEPVVICTADTVDDAHQVTDSGGFKPEGRIRNIIFQYGEKERIAQHNILAGGPYRPLFHTLYTY